MPEKILKFRLIWLATEFCRNYYTSCENEHFLACFRSFFEKDLAHYFKRQCTVQFGRTSIKNTSSLYNEKLYEVESIISFSDSELSLTVGKIYSKIFKLWCNKGECIRELQWLIPVGRFYNIRMRYDFDVSVFKIGFGTLVGLNCFIQHYQFKESDKMCRNIYCSFIHAEKKIIIVVYIEHHPWCVSAVKNFQKIEISYSSILRILVKDAEDFVPTEVYLYLESPPLLFVEISDSGSSSGLQSPSKKSEKKLEPDAYERTSILGCGCTNTLCHKDIIGTCPVLSILISAKNKSRHVLGRLHQKCYSHTEYYYCHVKSFTIDTLPKNLGSIVDFDLGSINSEVYRKTCNSLKEYTFLRGSPEDKFNCQYAWNVLLNRKFEVADHIALECCDWKRIIIQCFTKNPAALEKTFYCIFDLLEKGKILVLFQSIKFIFNDYDAVLIADDFPPGICLIRRLFITPSRTIFLPPQPHFKNRVLRNFDPDFALRVAFRDDNFGKLTFTIQLHTNRKEFLDDIIKKPLTSGIRLSDRHYKFLAASNSQVRDHGVWMYANDSTGVTSEVIRSWMGDFSSIYNTAKLLARMGQCFSTSEDAVQIRVKSKYVRESEDITIQQEGQDYVFSDGIGMISSNLTNEIHNALYQKKGGQEEQDWETMYKPSAFQIRYAGSKGMLVEMPLPANCKMLIRHSMNKFKCTTSDQLEIVKTSGPRALYLNRQLITILEQLGVHHEVFIRLQENMIMRMTDALIFETQARILLSDWIDYTFPFKKLYEVGVSLTEDPFFRSLLISIYQKDVGLLHTHARISIPHNFGRNMLGVLDESGTLNYGQVFVQYSENVGLRVSKTQVLKGPVLVTRNPCMHPGDVRKLEAIDVPLLHHIKDCIVFPAKGQRPHQDEMGGGDLDGDEFVVIWMPELIFPGDNIIPMDYPCSVANQTEGNQPGLDRVEGMIEFFCKYIEQDSIGPLANAHLANADKEQDGIFSSKCMSIAKKFPIALDFVKTGKSAYLDKSEKPYKYPDFMEKGGINNSYQSDRALGVLYRRSRCLKAVVNMASSVVSEIVLDPYLIYPGWEAYAESAKSEKEKYNQKVTRILEMYEIENEIEAICGNIRNISRYSQAKNEQTNLSSLVKEHFKLLFNKTRRSFLDEVSKESSSKGFSEEATKIAKYQRASSWYVMAYRDFTENSLSHLSFPWCIAEILTEVRIACLDISVTNSLNSLTGLEDKINSFLLKWVSIYSYYCDDNMEKLCAEMKCLEIGSKFCLKKKIAVKFLEVWISKYFSSLKEEKEKCPCLTKILQYFLEQYCTNAGKECNHVNVCKISISTQCTAEMCNNCDCSAAEILLSFFKFCAAFQISSDISNCSECGLNTRTLQVEALRTFTTLALTHNLSCLSVENAACFDKSVESETMKILVESQPLQDLLTHHLSEVENLLKKWSGVNHISIQRQQDSKGCWCMIVHCTGNDSSRWKLQELILQKSLPDMLEKQL